MNLQEFGKVVSLGFDLFMKDWAEHDCEQVQGRTYTS